MSGKHLTSGMSISATVAGEGSDFPPLEKDTLRLYGTRFCPCTQRVLLTLELKEIEYEVVYMNTRNKPSWYIEKSPTGLVPVLEINDQIVCESIICCEYLDEVYSDSQLAAETPYQRARDKMLINFFLSEMVPVIHKHSHPADGLDEKQKEMFFDNMEKVLTKRKSPYFRGDTPGLLDIVLWPSFERIEGMDVLDGDSHGLPADRFPLLTSWMDAMVDVPAVQKFFLSAEQHREFYKNYLRTKPLFDELLS
ncbi:glutathione S-transferase omega-1-like [Saccoglossus kowalevskii]|uniref:Glutathione S-transferase omega n=1 Tax=Saccoglossus kowalevskii TaxID=10224 RepID=A0ABM0MMB3_SACKO|nr:PREDICTED: glutathione S-transferase omega-1-like [Saccoglossus kowalevskii]